jgi:hypothetical protein
VKERAEYDKLSALSPTPEPVVGVIKSALRFRPLSELEKVRGAPLSEQAERRLTRRKRALPGQLDAIVARADAIKPRLKLEVAASHLRQGFSRTGCEH